MATKRLTERRIEGLKYDEDGPSKQVVFDSGLTGFGVRLYPSGRKTYVVQYGDRSRRKLMALGQVGALTLDQARGLAKNALYEVAAGGDPLEERKRERQERREALSVKELVDAYLDANEDRWSDAHASESRRRLEGPVCDAFGSVLAIDVQRSDVNRLHSEVTKRGAPVEANRVRTIVHSMFEWAAEFGHVPQDHPNPAAKRRGSKVGRNAERSRERYLKREEAPRLLKAADGTGNPRDGVVVRLWLLTGLRRSELLHRRWSDVDFKRRELTVPDTKNGTTHVLPLSDRAIQLLRSLPRSIVPDAPLFPGDNNGEPVSDFRKPWAKIRTDSGLSDLTIHDLRRTVGTWLVSLAGVPETTVSALLNHTRPGVTAIYTRPMDDAVREAVNELARMLAEVEKKAKKRKAADA